jgi:hypothetical protein
MRGTEGGAAAPDGPGPARLESLERELAVAMHTTFCRSRPGKPLAISADHELISMMRRMRSVSVAAKCWVSPDRAPEVREAAEVHLNLLRGQQPD